MRRSIALVDEIWAGSRFVADAFAAVSPVPVRHVPIPIPEPRPSQLAIVGTSPRSPTIGDRFVFLTAFDHLSVTERKNPLGVDRGVPPGVRAGRGAAAGHQDDERRINAGRSTSGCSPPPTAATTSSCGTSTCSVPDQMALVAAADCLVSLHRSEGLGLHLAEAMWLGTPTIATRYSGNLDFMDDDNSLLIDAELVHVERGEGVYPPSAKWADPDLDQAAAAMRRLAGDPALAARLAAAGRRTMDGAAVAAPRPVG